MSTSLDTKISFPSSFWNAENQNLFPLGLQNLLISLHEQFENERQYLLNNRQIRQRDYDNGATPYYLNRPEVNDPSWKVRAIPECLTQRRVEITGPVNSAKMVINMLSANEFGIVPDMAMLDFEDSMKPSFKNVLDGFKNVIGAVRGDLSFVTPEKTYKLDSKKQAYVMVRARGFHLAETNFKVNGTPISAGLFDLAVCFYHTAHLYLSQKKVPKYYIPKCEHYLEARWWNRLFTQLENSVSVPVGTLRATFLIETLPATYQIEDILFETKEHIAGLNVGRWDKIFSDIKVLKKHKDKILTDRANINMLKPWMENYAKRVIKLCHSRGAFAMGGMSAFTPGKDPEVRAAQTAKVFEDKKREATWGHDGCWVSHPYFTGFALQAFTKKNQIEVTLPRFPKNPDILPEGHGPYTINGLRTNIRVGIAYMQGWNNDIGCVSYDNLMEDLATLEISRAQVWQWMFHQITLDDGTKVTKDLIKKIFGEELTHILKEFDTKTHDSFKKAAKDAETIFTNDTLNDFLTLASDEVK